MFLFDNTNKNVIFNIFQAFFRGGVGRVVPNWTLNEFKAARLHRVEWNYIYIKSSIRTMLTK